MNKIYRKDSFISGVSYNPFIMRLSVTFKKNNVKYEYSSVPLITFLVFLFTRETGSYYQKNIRTTYNYKKVGS